MLGTPYLEKLTMKPFGPVDNGSQSLYGLDYKTAMWRDDEENPFHTEVGYWLWDAATGEVLRGFVVPRGITVLAGGTGVAADATEFTLGASPGRPALRHRREHVPRARRQLDARLRRHHHHRTPTAPGPTTRADDAAMVEFAEPFLHTDYEHPPPRRLSGARLPGDPRPG